MPELPEVETVRRGWSRCWWAGPFCAPTCGGRTCAGRFRRGWPSGCTARASPASGGVRNTCSPTWIRARRCSCTSGCRADAGLGNVGRASTIRTRRRKARPPGARSRRRGAGGLQRRAAVRIGRPLAQRRPGARTACWRGWGRSRSATASTRTYLAGRLAGRATSVKAALLDQRTVAGLGNIYVCEALWRAGDLAASTGPRRVGRRGRGAGRGDPVGACRCARRRRLVAAGLPPRRRRTRLLPARLRRLRPRRRRPVVGAAGSCCGLPKGDGRASSVRPARLDRGGAGVNGCRWGS